MCPEGSSQRAQSENHIVRVWAPRWARRWARRNTVRILAMPCRTASRAARGSVTYARACATELGTCAIGWVAPVFMSVVCACSHTAYTS